MSHVSLPEQMCAYGVELHRLRREDMELVRQWRNHPDVARHMLTSEYIDPQQQVAWFEQTQDAEDRRYYLASYRNQPTAFASVTGATGRALADNDELEAAIYLAPASRYRGTLLAFAPALALNDACFDVLSCKHLVARVKISNDPALRFNARLGYRETGRDTSLVYMRLEINDYLTATSGIKRILTRRNTSAHNTNGHRK